MLEVPVWTALPFVFLLGCIALLPLLCGHWWHSNRNRALVSFGLAFPVVAYFLKIDDATHGESGHLLFHEVGNYVSFISMLLALYTIAGGILLLVDLPVRPGMNTLILLVGALIANVIGTTGASMLLIRPFLRINHARRRKAHLPVFFIFIVSNTGGLLTPLGDPPLFLGFLQGVDFFWTLNLWPEWLFVNGLLLATFFVWDGMALKREPKDHGVAAASQRHATELRGLALNGTLLMCVLLTIILQSASIGKGLGNALKLSDLTLQSPWAELLLLSLALLSYLLTPKSIRRGNGFIWAPMVEVAVIFAGIFITMTPAPVVVSSAWRFLWAQPTR